MLPDTQIVAGALEDSRFCVEKKELREMFENLIAASVNSDTADSVHPSFSNIIRRMSPHDASILKMFKERGNRPIANFVCHYKTGGFSHYYQNIFRAVDNFSAMEQDSLSLECLRSLGLISISYDSYLSNDAQYELLKNSKLLLETQDLFSCNPGISLTLEKCDFQKGVVSLTDFGTRFLKTCT